MEWFGICSSVSNTRGRHTGLGGLKDAFVKYPSWPTVLPWTLFQGYDPTLKKLWVPQVPAFSWPSQARLIQMVTLPYSTATTGHKASLPHAIALPISCSPSYMPLPDDLSSHTASLTLKQMTRSPWLPIGTHVRTAGLSRPILPFQTFPSAHLPCVASFSPLRDTLFQITLLVCLPPSSLHALAHAHPSDKNAFLKFNPLTTHALLKTQVIPLIKWAFETGNPFVWFSSL